MNSEQLQVIEGLEIEQKDQSDNKASKVVHDMLELQEMPGWKLLAVDLTNFKEGLIKTLLEVKTLKETQYLQGRIKNIDLFINTPAKYINQSKSYLNRRDKWKRQ